MSMAAGSRDVKGNSPGMIREFPVRPRREQLHEHRIPELDCTVQRKGAVHIGDRRSSDLSEARCTH